MNILAIVHQADAGPGVFADAISARGHGLELWQPALGEPAPADLASYGAAITFGGSPHPDQEHAYPWLAAEKALLTDALERNVPLLGVCLGAELLAEVAGARTRPARIPEIGWYSVAATDEAVGDPLFDHLPAQFAALEWHSYEFALPPGAVPLARSEICLQAYRAGEMAWGIQFHAEVTLESFGSWIEQYHSDPDAVRLGIDPATLLAEAKSEIQRWNDLGRALCTGFLEAAERAGSGVQLRDSG